MKDSIKRVFYCFTAYDIRLKKRVKCNCNTLYGARYYRNELLMDSNYKGISDIFTDTLEIGNGKY